MKMNDKTGLVAEKAEGVMQKIQSSILLLRETSKRADKLLKTLDDLKEEIVFVRAKLLEVGFPGQSLEVIRCLLYETNGLVDQIYTAAKARQMKQPNLLTSCCHSRCYLWKCFQFDTKEVIAMTKRYHEIIVDTQDTAGGIAGQTVAATDVIGRDDDKYNILKMLQVLDNFDSASGSRCNKISTISIFGTEGLGKTALADIVYNDNVVKQHFKLRFWVCVGDDFRLPSIIHKIVEKKTVGKKPPDDLEDLQLLLRRMIEGERFLLVLDNVWDYHPDTWGRLIDLLSTDAAPGSKIITTTRFINLANSMSTVEPYSLKELSEVDAWSLFEKVAFQPGEGNRDSELILIGKQIVKKVSKVPGFIEDIGSQLLGEHKDEWKRVLSQWGKSSLSYSTKLPVQQLSSPLKQCFAYCAIYPMDHEIDKCQLIQLWIAQGFICEPLDDKHQTLEDAGEECFMNLLNWSFFKDLIKDDKGNIRSFKMHRFAFNQARSIAGGESMVIQDSTSRIPDVVHHLYFDGSLLDQSSNSALKNLTSSASKHLHSLLIEPGLTMNLTESDCGQLFLRLKHLRVLDLNKSKMVVVPDSIGSLKHLRYLNLSYNEFKSLPSSITRLINLQVLDLSSCTKLKELPKHLRRLLNLRHLYLSGCVRLMGMPVGMGQMTSLQTLSHFVLGKGQNCCKLDELSSLNLKAELTIVFACKQQT